MTDKCSRKDCVDFDLPIGDVESVIESCEDCRECRLNPHFPTDISNYVKVEAVVNPTVDVPAQTGAYPILPQTEENFADVSEATFTPIPIMKDRRDTGEISIKPDVLKIFTPYVKEAAEVSDEVYTFLKPGPLFADDELETEKDIKDSGKRTEFSTGAVRDAQGGKGRFDLLPNMAVWALAHHTEKGCEKYGDRNWEKGIPIKNFVDSAKRHLTEFELGLTDENHMAAALWNIACCYETLLRIDMGILPESLNEGLAYPLRGVIEDGEMVMAWDRLRHPKLKV